MAKIGYRKTFDNAIDAIHAYCSGTSCEECSFHNEKQMPCTRFLASKLEQGDPIICEALGIERVRLPIILTADEVKIMEDLKARSVKKVDNGDCRLFDEDCCAIAEVAARYFPSLTEKYDEVTLW